MKIGAMSPSDFAEWLEDLRRVLLQQGHAKSYVDERIAEMGSIYFASLEVSNIGLRILSQDEEDRLETGDAALLPLRWLL